MSDETGTLAGGHPYFRVGDGPRTLVVLPGISDAMFDGRFSPNTRRAARLYLRRFTDAFTVYVVSRPRGLARGTTTRDMADGYARVVESEFGSADVAGVSMGGLVAQELAAAHPERVDRLVLASTARRVAADCDDVVRRWDEWARERRWADIRADLARLSFVGWRRNALPPVLATGARPFLPRPTDPGDVRVSLAAVADHDSTDRLDRIEAPTLVANGERDVFFPPALARETAAAVSDGVLRVFESVGHAAFHERKAAFDGTVRGFLTGDYPRWLPGLPEAV